jgi:glyoxylase-like metal-dependent hydrolase (beta-lactamase superfamily II)
VIGLRRESEKITMGKASAKGVLAVLLSGLVASAAASEVVDLGQGISLMPGRFVAGEQPDGNSVLIEAPSGIVVFDAGRSVTHTQRILDRLAAAAPEQVILINSHWHLDHSGGLDALRKAYPQALLFANDAAIRNIGAPFLVSYREQLVAGLRNADEPVPEDAKSRAELALIGGSIAFYPTNNVPRSRDVELAGRKVHLGLGNAVSGGDVWLRTDDAGVLIAGDLVTLPAPLLDTACAEIWLDDLNVLWAQDFERLVPGHGRVLAKDEFRIWQLAFEDLMKCSNSRKSAEDCRDGWLKGTRKLEFSDADRALATQVLDHAIPNLLRDEAVQAKYCAGR